MVGLAGHAAPGQGPGVTMKRGESVELEAGAILTMGENRLVISSEIQRTASKKDIAAHLRCVAARIDDIIKQE